MDSGSSSSESCLAQRAPGRRRRPGGATLNSPSLLALLVLHLSPRRYIEMLVANFGLAGPASPPRRTRSPSTSPGREPTSSSRRRPPPLKPRSPSPRAPSSTTSTSSHAPRELFPNDDALAATASSPTRRGAPGPPSQDTSPRPCSSPTTRHHLRSASLLEAAHIEPRDATWQCKGVEQGLCFATPDESARSWEDEPGPSYGAFPLALSCR